MFKSTPKPPVSYSIPYSYLQHCEFGGWEFNTVGELEAAYVEAAMCARTGNEDKARIRELISE